MPGFFYTGDNTPLEIEYHPAENPRMCLVVWPCMTGSFRMYRLPVKLFTGKGISILLYNPRAHGESGGQFTRNGSSDDLKDYLSEKALTGIPLSILGHSAGANGALKFPACGLNIEHYYLAAPVLDSCESLEYMYDSGTIQEFNIRIAQFSRDQHLVFSVLQNRRWLDAGYWRSENLKNRLNDVSDIFRIGSFLEELFIPTHNAFDELAICRNITTMLLSTDDRWYPRKRIDELCEKHHITRCIIPDAADHFFTGAWGSVWKMILEDLEAHQQV